MKMFEFKERKKGSKIVIDELCKCGHLITHHHDLVPNLPQVAKGCGRCADSLCLCLRFTFESFVYEQPKENDLKLLGYATLIKVDDSKTVIERYTPFKLEALQSFVGGYIEIIPTKDGRLMVINEEGRLKNLSYNMTATDLVEYDLIVGDVLVCDKNLIK